MTLYAKVNDLLSLAARYATRQVDVPDKVTLIYAEGVGYVVNQDTANQIMAAKIAGIIELPVQVKVQCGWVDLT